jgi:RHS repeat-associated protein
VYESKTYSNTSLTPLNYADVLQFIAHEEGRTRIVNGAFVYDYFIKDHLGNVRMTLTDETKTDDYPAATMEPGAINTESTWYGNLTNTQYTKPSWFNDPAYTGSTKVAQVKNTSGVQKIGPNIILKVMAGDTYNIRVASGWNGGIATNSSTNVLNDLLSLLSAGMANLSGGKATQAELQNTNSGLNAGLTSFLGTQTTSGSKPKAYINWILLDEQFKIAKDASGNMIATGYSGFDQVKDAGSAYVHYFTNLTVNKSGYLYIYTSNEATNIDVFFDNLQVTHTRGALLEENSYYPFGLTMAGISSRALNFGSPENKIKFQKQEFATKEFSDGSGIDMYEFKWRMHDPQIGRFWQVDPLSDKYFYNSTYAFSENKVIAHIELEGLESVESNDPRVRAMMNENVQKKAQSANQKLSNSVEVKVSVGAGVGVQAKVGKVGVQAEVNGPQAQVTINATTGKTKADANAAGAGVKVNTPIGDAGAGVSVGNVKVENGKLETNVVQGNASAQLEASKEIKQEDMSGKVSANTKGEVSVGAKLGFFGFLIKLNPINIATGMAEALGTIITYKVEETKERSGNPLINKNVNRGPGN